MRSDLRSHNFDLAKFQDILPRNPRHGAFFFLELGLRILENI